MKNAFVIRTVGEQTTEQCISLCKAQLSENWDVYVHSFFPLEKSLYENLKIARNGEYERVAIIDADILPYGDALQRVERLARIFISSNIFRIEFYFDDHLTGEVKRGGIKVYNTAKVKEALGLLNLGEKIIRPENKLKDDMLVHHGLKSLVIPVVIGVHDEFQDLRKVFGCFRLYRVKFSTIDVLAKIQKRYRSGRVNLGELVAATLGYYSKELKIDSLPDELQLVSIADKSRNKGMNRSRVHIDLRAYRFYSLYARMVILKIFGKW